jgi:radical SAM superfamily enzyme YgiQ (UPF0313 family)
MKICLVPFPIIIDSSDAVGQKKLYPYLPLGLLTISALLEQANHEVTILDLIWKTSPGLSGKFVLPNPEDVAHLIKTKAPDLVGFSTIFSSYPLVIKWAELFHHLSPRTPIVLGGPQATATDEQTLRAFTWIDMVLRGEAENSIVPLVTCLQSGGNLASVPALTWRDRNEILRNPDAPIVSDLDTLPIPAYHLYPMSQLSQYYTARKGLYHHNFAIEAGRGCPFNCSFCSTSSFFQRRYRTKSVYRLIHEMVNLHTKYGLDHFDFSHDLFTCNNAYVLEFCQRLRARGLHKTLKWGCYSRIDTVDQKIIAEMASAGCSGIHYGIETGSQRMQKLIGKNLPIKQVNTVVKETLSLGINVSMSFICGFPQENQEDLSATCNLAMDMIYMGVDQMIFLPLYPLVGSELYRIFGDTLCYDGSWSSDLLYGCLSQEDEERVIKWPRIFASFYHYETPGLDYDVLRALLRVINRYPRLLAALSKKDIDVMSIFEFWPEWHHSRITLVSEQYYRQKGFFLDFLQFLQDNLNSKMLMTSDLNDIIHYYAVKERVSSAPVDTPITSERFNSDVLALMQHLVDGKPLAKEALQSATYLFWKTHGNVISKRLTPALAELLGIPQA